MVKLEELLQVPECHVWREHSRGEIVEGSSVIYQFVDRRLNRPVQAHLDGYPERKIGDAVMIRFATQSGCALSCTFCAASRWQEVTNLDTGQIVGQVVRLLGDPAVTRSPKRLVLASFGLGEPTMNPNAAAAFERLAELFPSAELIVSTTGPKFMARGFAQLIESMKRIGAAIHSFRLQLSVHGTRDEERRAFAGRSLAPIAELAGYGRHWAEQRGEKAIVNLGIGPDFPPWLPGDGDLLFGQFSPDAFEIKLSPQAAANGETDRIWSAEDYAGELRSRHSLLTSMGYSCTVYDPDGLEIGAGCGSQM